MANYASHLRLHGWEPKWCSKPPMHVASILQVRTVICCQFDCRSAVDSVAHLQSELVCITAEHPKNKIFGFARYNGCSLYDSITLIESKSTWILHLPDPIRTCRILNPELQAGYRCRLGSVALRAPNQHRHNSYGHRAMSESESTEQRLRLISSSENKTALLLWITSAAQEVNARAWGLLVAVSDESLFLRAARFGLGALARHHQIEQHDQRTGRQHFHERIEHLFIC